MSLVFPKLFSSCSTLVLAPEEFVSLAEMEDTLLRNLFRGYQKWVRPVLHANDTITVRFGLKISQLVDVVRHTHISTVKSDLQLSLKMHEQIAHTKSLMITISYRDCVKIYVDNDDKLWTFLLDVD